MKTIKSKKLKNHLHIGIIRAENWFDTNTLFHSPMVRLDDFVIGQWYDFHDGSKSHIEAKQTIAICRKKEDAELLFNAQS